MLQIEKAHLLLVEGKDEEAFFESLIQHLGIPGIQVLSVGGKDQFRPV